jgi:hypothetical protein
VLTFPDTGEERRRPVAFCFERSDLGSRHRRRRMRTTSRRGVLSAGDTEARRIDVRRLIEA